MGDATMALWVHLCRLVPVSLRIQERHRQGARGLAAKLQAEGFYAALAPTVTTSLVLRLAIERGLDSMIEDYRERGAERARQLDEEPRQYGPAPT